MAETWTDYADERPGDLLASFGLADKAARRRPLRAKHSSVVERLASEGLLYPADLEPLRLSRPQSAEMIDLLIGASGHEAYQVGVHDIIELEDLEIPESTAPDVTKSRTESGTSDLLWIIVSQSIRNNARVFRHAALFFAGVALALIFAALVNGRVLTPELFAAACSALAAAHLFRVSRLLIS